MIDLGLPSGTLWASFNLGATRPDEFGDHFAWGETAPKTEFNSSNYTWFANNRFTKYVVDISALKPELSGEFYDGKSILEPEDDAATANLGDKWRMPTAGEAASPKAPGRSRLSRTPTTARRSGSITCLPESPWQMNPRGSMGSWTKSKVPLKSHSASKRRTCIKETLQLSFTGWMLTISMGRTEPVR